MTNLLLILLISFSCQQEAKQTDTAQPEAYTAEQKTTEIDSPNAPLNQHYTNTRYHFSIAYPDGWLVLESENQDGATFTHPDDPSILFRAYGSQPMDEFFSPEEIAKIEDPNERFENYQEEDQKDFSVQAVKDEDQMAVKATLRRFSYTQEGIPYRMLQLSIEHPKRKIMVECEAPTERFAQYEETFDEISKSVRLLKGEN